MDCGAFRESNVCRIFISSPFRGLEDERDELSRHYWPRLQALCASRGVSLRLVDMRWGITNASTSLAQTTAICLKEIDRSDIFVGIYAQRYGWHGKDTELQRNYNVAQDHYPWLGKYRDRSITEVEFLHGHLNSPGSRPACFAFRDKAYDDRCCKVCEKNDTGRARCYISESDAAARQLGDLKKRVFDTQAKCLGVNMNYGNPKEGAEYIFSCVWKYLQDKVFATPPGPPPTKRELHLAAHAAFRAARTEVYVDEQGCRDKVTKFVQDATPGVLLVTGTAGSGKSALLANWLQERTVSHPKDVLVSHFVGSASGSTQLRSMLKRLCEEIELESRDRQIGPMMTSLVRRMSTWHISDPGQQRDNQTTPTEHTDFQRMLTECGMGAKKGTTFVIVVDGLNRIDNEDRMVKPMYWVPEWLPGNVKLILATNDEDKENIRAVCDITECARIELQPLNAEEKRIFCLRLLDVNSKQLTADEQLPLVLDSPHTALPMYLKIVIEELCHFASYQKLTEKIKTLVSAKSVRSLFEQFLMRLEDHYDPSKERITEILGTLCLCRVGVTEAEICAMWRLEDTVWSPIYFAIRHVLISREGKLRLGYEELVLAVEKRYLSNEAKARIVGTMASFFYRQFQDLHSRHQDIPTRLAEELPYHLRRLLPSSQEELIKVVTSIPMYAAMMKICAYDIMEHWFSLSISMEQLAALYIRSLDDYVASHQSEDDNSKKTKGVPFKIYDVWDDVRLSFCTAKIYTAEEEILQRSLKLLDDVYDVDGEKRDRIKVELISNLAMCKCDRESYVEGTRLHQEAVTMAEKLPSCPQSEHILANALHGLAVIEMMDKSDMSKIALAEQKFRQSLAIYEEQEDRLSASRCLTNLGLVRFYRRDIKDAVKTFEKVMEMQRQIYYDRDSIDISYTWLNLGLCYRHLNDLGKTADCYQKSLDIKVKALGWKNYDVGLTLMNLCSLEMHRQEYHKALDYATKCRDIYEELLPSGHSHLLMIQENLILAYMHNERTAEMEDLFWKIYTTRKETGTISNTLPAILKRMIDETYRRKDLTKCEDLLVSLLGTDFEKRPADFCRLYVLDKAKPAASRPTRPENMSLQRARELFPTSDIVFDTYLNHELMAGLNLPDIKRAAEELYSARQASGHDRGSRVYGYTVGAHSLMQAARPQDALELLQDCPDQTIMSIWAGLYRALDKLGRKGDAFKYKKLMLDADKAAQAAKTDKSSS